jgi:colanic acid biosynthesis glycosyl transferase WcaI
VKILILSMNFAPDRADGGCSARDFAAWLSESGHDVRVITAPPCDPEWGIQDGRKPWIWRRETLGAVPVLRCPLWGPAAATPLARVLHMLSFGASCLVPSLWQAARFRPDLVWAVAPTACAAPAALLAARLCGARACLHVQAPEAGALDAVGLAARPRLRGRLRRAYGWVARRFDLVSTICTHMRARLRGYGIPEERLCLFPNWVDTDAIRPVAAPSLLRRQWGFLDHHVVALYAGSMGEKQRLQILVEIAERLRSEPEVQLVLCGAGAAPGWLEHRIPGCANVTLLAPPPEARLNELLNAADIHLLPQPAGTATFALPSGLAAILASGRPVVAQAEDGELAAATRRCGILVPPGDAAAMADAILELAADPAHRRRLGAVARQLALEHLERDAILARYEQRLVWLVARQRSGGRWNARHPIPTIEPLVPRTPAHLRRG